MMIIRVATILASVFLGRAQGVPVEDAKTAIRLADRACHESWGRMVEKMGNEWSIKPKDWQARIKSDHWKVWVGDENNPSYSIEVRRDGTMPDPVSCKHRFDD